MIMNTKKISILAFAPAVINSDLTEESSEPRSWGLGSLWVTFQCYISPVPPLVGRLIVVPGKTAARSRA